MTHHRTPWMAPDALHFPALPLGKTPPNGHPARQLKFNAAQRQINASKTLILVIEDDPALRESLSELLHLNQFTVIGVATGAAGIAQAGEQAPHCILCDLSLPDIDGFVVLRQLKSNPQTQHIPVIVLSGYTEPTNQELAIHLGATGYVTKPYEFQDLLDIINRVIQPGS